MINFLLLIKLWPIVITLLIVSGFAVYVYLKTPTNYYLKLGMVPLTLALAISSYLLIGEVLGTSYPVDKLPKKFVFLAYNTIVKDDKPIAIEVWVKDNPSRLYRIPYTKEMAEKFKEAEGQKANGSSVKFEGQENTWAMDILNPYTVMPKDGGDQP